MDQNDALDSPEVLAIAHVLEAMLDRDDDLDGFVAYGLSGLLRHYAAGIPELDSNFVSSFADVIELATNSGDDDLNGSVAASLGKLLRIYVDRIRSVEVHVQAAAS